MSAEQTGQDYQEKQVNKEYSQTPEQEQAILDGLTEEKKSILKRIDQLKIEAGFKNTESVILDSSLNAMGPAIDTEDESENQTAREKIQIMQIDVEYANKELFALEQQLKLSELQNTGEELSVMLNRLSGLAEDDIKSGFGLENVSEGGREAIRKTLESNGGLKGITAGDIYMMKQEGVDLAALFLIQKGENTSKEEIVKGSEIIVNFGGNREANRNVGAGDLLPIDRVSKIQINGVEGERKSKPRPGYYTPQGKYLPIYDGDKILILVDNEPFKEGEKAKFDVAALERFNDMRTSEIINWIRKEISENGDSSNIQVPFTSESDLNIFKKYIKNVFPAEIKDNIQFDEVNNSLYTVDNSNISELLKKIYAYEGKGIGHVKYQESIQKLSSQYGVPEGMIIRLIYHENRRWDPTIKAPGSSAFGLGQIIDGTWKRVNYDGKLDRYNAHDQLEGTARYMSMIKNNKNCSWEEVLAFYNTGEGILRVSSSKVRDYYDKNPAIARKVNEGGYNRSSVTPKIYFTGAVAYYNDLSFKEAQNRI